MAILCTTNTGRVIVSLWSYHKLRNRRLKHTAGVDNASFNTSGKWCCPVRIMTNIMAVVMSKALGHVFVAQVTVYKLGFCLWLTCLWWIEWFFFLRSFFDMLLFYIKKLWWRCLWLMWMTIGYVGALVCWNLHSHHIILIVRAWHSLQVGSASLCMDSRLVYKARYKVWVRPLWIQYVDIKGGQTDSKRLLSHIEVLI